MDKVIQFLSTPSARRATVVGVVLALVDGISIHALREEGDFCGLLAVAFIVLFLSTPSARRATRPQRLRGHQRAISIHALREEGDLTANCILAEDVISIHALREEGDKSSKEA